MIVQLERRADVMCSYRAVIEEHNLGGDIVDGLKSWRGTFSTDDLFALQDGVATLTLPDGRRGEILVRTVHVSNGGPERGEFTGNGNEPL